MFFKLYLTKSTTELTKRKLYIIINTSTLLSRVFVLLPVILSPYNVSLLNVMTAFSDLVNPFLAFTEELHLSK